MNEFTPVRSVSSFAVSYNGDILWKYPTKKEAEEALCWASWRYNWSAKDMCVVALEKVQLQPKCGAEFVVSPWWRQPRRMYATRS